MVALLLALALICAWPGVATAQTPPVPTADLALLILPDAFPGFEPVEGIPGLPDGPVDLSEQAEPGTDELTLEQLRAVEAYGRTWTNAQDDLVIIVLYKLPRTVEAELFFAGLQQGVRQQFAEVSNFDVPSIPGAVGFTYRPEPQGPPAYQVTLRKGNRIAEVFVGADAGRLGRDDVIALAERQAMRLPGASAEAASTADSDLTYQIGGALIVAIVMLGIAVIATQGAKRRREAPQPPPVPGSVGSESIGAITPIERVPPKMLRGLGRRGQVAILLLGVSGGLAVAASVIGVGLADRLVRLRDGRPVNLDTLESLENLYDGISMGQVGALVVTGIAWLMWQHRGQRILGELQDTRFTPGAAVGWWFVPFANLVMPYRTMSELYRGSASPASRSARSPGPMVLLTLWWLTFIATTILGRVARTLDDSLDELITRGRLLLAIDLCYLFAAAMAIGLIRLVYRGLNTRATEEVVPEPQVEASAPAWPPGVPPPPPPLPPALP